MFCDEVHIHIASGKGGDGLVSYRREKYIPKGGPYGGDGGNGGDVIIRVNTNLNTLSHLRNQKNYSAENGEGGKTQKMHGRNGEDLIIEVPHGSLIIDDNTQELYADLENEDDYVVLCEGGRGGYGNAHFVSSVRQCPDFAELGDIAEHKDIRIELKLVADIGIIGMPSAGKSTMIAAISNVRPKIAEYHFTTIIPNLGVVDVDDDSFVVVDIPGLIEGASEGKGLGHQFLRHVERTRFLVHLVDVLELDKALENYETINRELAHYSETLAEKEQILVLNKMDSIDEESLKLVVEAFETKHPELKGKIYTMSAVTHQNVQEVLRLMALKLREYKAVEQKEVKEEQKEVKVYKPHQEDPKRWHIDEYEGCVQIRGKRIEQIVRMTNTTQLSAMLRIFDIFDKMGITKTLEQRGVKDGDDIYVGEIKIEYRDTSFLK